MIFTGKNNVNTLVLDLPEGDDCTGDEKASAYPVKYKTQVVIKCDKSAIKEPVLERASGFNSCNPTVVLRSSAVCRGERYVSWVEALGVNYRILSIIFMVLGITICFFGNKIRTVYFVTLKFSVLALLLVIYFRPILGMSFWCKI